MKKLACLLLFFLSFSFVHSAQEVKQEIVDLLNPKLNSDRIAYFFGNCDVEIIKMDASPFGECRISSLYSMEKDQRIMRTLAVVNFTQPVQDSLKKAHQEITQGQLIGVALRQNGWKIDKVPMYFGYIGLSPQVLSWMKESSCDRAAIHIYKLDVYKTDSPEGHHYCTIIEVHSPQYLDEHWLQALYPDQYNHFRENTNEVDALINSLSELIRHFPAP